jgi:hypothetical protein
MGIGTLTTVCAFDGGLPRALGEIFTGGQTGRIRLRRLFRERHVCAFSKDLWHRRLPDRLQGNGRIHCVVLAVYRGLLQAITIG